MYTNSYEIVVHERSERENQTCGSSPLGHRARRCGSIFGGPLGRHITFNGESIPFRLQIAGDGSKLQGWLFNGDDKVVASGGSFQNGSLVLNFDSYAAKLEAKLQDGALVGQYGPMLKKTFPVTAHRHQADPTRKPMLPSINGLWEVAVKSSKGEQAWRLIVQQKSASNVSAAIFAWTATPAR